MSTYAPPTYPTRNGNGQRGSYAKPSPDEAERRQRNLERAYVLGAAELADEVIALLDRVESPDWRLVETGIGPLDAALTIAPSTVTVLSGRPGMGKSTVAKILAMREMRGIARSEHAGKRVVVYVTLEEGADKLAIQLGGVGATYRDIVRGDYDRALIRRRADRLVTTLGALKVIRHPGIMGGRLAPAVSAEIVLRSVERMVADEGLVVSMLVLDYLQLMKADGREASERSKTEHVTAASNGAVMLSRSLRCPVILAVQAGRDVDNRALPLPTLADMQFASAIEQDADNILGLYRPASDEKHQAKIDAEGESWIEDPRLKVTPELMLMNVIKSRNDGCAGWRFGAHVDPVRFEMHSIDMRG